MAEIRVENAVKTFGKIVAVDNVTLHVRDQEFVVLLGPSGCGKTTLLRAVAGLGMVNTGRVYIGNRDVTYLPPKERGISMVFQSYAIFPHMSVRENIAFGLKMKRAPKDKIERRVRSAAELLHIEEFLDRYPAQLSGGQRQRVAVARAIAYEAEVLLMDEPLSNLDALLRLEMRAELKRLLNEIKATTIYVTHDQIEALSMGDRIAVMNQGRILQFDTPTTVYDMPADRFVAGFIGTPPMNFLEGQVRYENGTVNVYIGDFAIKPIPELHDTLRQYDGKRIVVGIRAENMEALSEPAEDALEVTVLVVEPLGSQNLLTIQIDDDIIKVSTHPDFPAAMNKRIWIRFPGDKIRWIDRDTGRTLIPDLEKLATA